MKRTLYFLRDSITGLYYTDRTNKLWNLKDDVPVVCTDENSPRAFKNAVIHTTKSSAEYGLKKRYREYKRQLKFSDSDVELCHWWRLERNLAREREKLPNFGIEVVKIEVSDNV